MPYYSFSFSLMVVERFTKCHPRGWSTLRSNLDNFYLEDLVEIFQTSQVKWNILKRIIKLVDRTWRPNYYTYVKLRELYRYFKPYALEEIPHHGLTKSSHGLLY